LFGIGFLFVGFLVCAFAVFWFMISLNRSTSSDRFRENVRVFPIIIPELKLRDVKREIFPAHLMEAAHDAAFEDAPEAFNRVCVSGGQEPGEHGKMM
jgi:hypothetical protein